MVQVVTGEIAQNLRIMVIIDDDTFGGDLSHHMTKSHKRSSNGQFIETTFRHVRVQPSKPFYPPTKGHASSSKRANNMLIGYLSVF